MRFNISSYEHKIRLYRVSLLWVRKRGRDREEERTEDAKGPRGISFLTLLCRRRHHGESTAPFSRVNSYFLRRNEPRLFLEIVFTISFRFGARVGGPWKSIHRPLIGRFHFTMGTLHGMIWSMTLFRSDDNNLSLLRAHVYANTMFLGNLIIMFPI